MSNAASKLSKGRARDGSHATLSPPSRESGTSEPVIIGLDGRPFGGCELILNHAGPPVNLKWANGRVH